MIDETNHLRPSLSWGDCLMMNMQRGQKIETIKKYLKLILPAYTVYLEKDSAIERETKKIRIRSTHELERILEDLES